MHLSRKISIAPMMACTDRHFRYLARLLTKHVLLYSEMVTANAIIYGPRQRLLDFNADEQPLALQLGGSDPGALAKAAQIGEQWGYNEINLNVGCPSDRVHAGQFGLYLLQFPDKVADCVAAMKAACRIPITVKTRIGVDHCDSFEALVAFVDQVSAAGCRSFTLHARKGWLQGLSPRENRHIPPLCYPTVYALKRHFPQLEIIINGGITTNAAVMQHLSQVDGVMIGREAYGNLYWLSDFDRRYYADSHPILSRKDILLQYLPYLSDQISAGVPLRLLVKPILGLFQGVPGAKRWRHFLCESARHQRGLAMIEQKIINDF